MERKKFAVVGGDLRMIAAARKLSEAHSVTLCGFELQDARFPGDHLCCSGGTSERLGSLDGLTLLHPEKAVKGADAVILPLPATQDNLNVSTPFSDNSVSFDALLGLMKENGVGRLFGGMLGGASQRFEDAGIKTTDYYKREEFAVLNAVPTAEGAIGIALDELRITLHGSKSLVIGNGRIGKILASKLAALGSDVTVSARKPLDFALISAAGLRHAPTDRLYEIVREGFDVIFNTVPHTVLGRRELENLPPETLIIDLASKPGGVDIACAGALGRRVIWALSLPGKCAPVSAGRIIAETILGCVREDEVC